jgi:ATP-dependent Clp protease ATP-binding subunit ClpA
MAAIRAGHTLARRMNHLKLGAEHLLVGLLRQTGGTATKILSDLGTDVPRLCAAVECTMVPGDTVPPRRLGRTPEAKRAMRLAHREMQAAGQTRIGEECLLLGLAIGAEGQLAELCRDAGVEEKRLRRGLGTHGQSEKPARQMDGKAAPIDFGEPPVAAIVDRGSPAAMTHRGYSDGSPESVAAPDANSTERNHQ